MSLSSSSSVHQLQSPRVLHPPAEAAQPVERARPRAAPQAKTADQFVQSAAASKWSSVASVSTTAEAAASAAKLKSDPDSDSFSERTDDFRQVLELGRSLKSQLDKLPPADPRRPGLEQAVNSAERHLSERYGYTFTTAPKPGAVWVAPQFTRHALPDLEFNARNFPTARPVLTAPPAIDALFARGAPISMQDAAGATVSVRTPEEYKTLVASNRKALDMPRQDGEPIGVHLNVQGGGGRGKRYASALAEMSKIGVVPVSISGASAGAIAASLIAAGATSKDIDDFAKDPRLGELYDLDLSFKGGGVLDGENAFKLFDAELRRITGIQDRPVTFADLKVPLKIGATVFRDTDPPAGHEDLSKRENREFIFSQETTPDTPVALAVRASMSMPGVFDPVRMVDPATGRQMTLVDGGALNNIMVNQHEPRLPEVGLGLVDRGFLDPKFVNGKPRPVAEGDLDTGTVLGAIVHGWLMQNTTGTLTDDFLDRTQPPAGNFMLSLPTWNLQNPKEKNKVLKFGYDPEVDPKLDAQTRGVTLDFFRQHLGRLQDPEARATNLDTQKPSRWDFSQDIEVSGKKYQVSYSGDGGWVRVKAESGKQARVRLGEKNLREMLLDNQNFHDLRWQLAHELSGKLNFKLLRRRA